LRRELIARRNDISMIENAELSARACEALLKLPEYARAGTVLCYKGIRSELETRGFIMQALADGKRVCLPKIAGDSLVAVRYTPESGFVPGRFGTLEPASSDIVPAREIEIAIVPGVGFDLNGGRIGYGKGYFDRYLKEVHCPRVGVAFGVQIVEDVFSDEWDVKMDVVATDRGTFVCGNEGRGQ